MTYGRKAYVEHVAIRVGDIDWHVRFFAAVLGMSVREVQGSEPGAKQVWTIGGMQLKSDPGFVGPEGRLAHIGIMVDDLEGALEEAARWGVRELPQGRNWLALPDGLELELMQAHAGSVEQALAVQPRG